MSAPKQKSQPQRPAAPPDARGIEPSRAAAPILRPDPTQRLAKPAKKPQRHGLYAAAWALSGLIASAYVFTLVLRQDGGMLVARGDADAVTRTQADVAQLQHKVGQLETDMARVKIDQAQADDREKQLVQRVGSIENRVEAFSAQIAQATAPAAPTKQAKAAPAEKQPAARIATGALPQPPVPTAEQQPARKAEPAAGAAGEPQAGVLLARGPSLDALRLSWSLLNERYKGTLKSMEPRVVEVEPGTYQLIAGPVANPAEAMKVCATLKARGVACQASDFKGSAL